MEEQTNQSTTIGKLATALAVVQGQLEGAVKDKENPFYHSQYADLKACWDSCRHILSENGLAVIQTNGGTAQAPSVITTLAHISGEWIRGELPMPPEKKGPQGIGSALTYARRYALCGMIGICPLDGSSDEDDDAEKATERQEDEATKKPNTASNEGWTLTDDPVPSEYWKDKDQSLLGGKGHTARKNPMGKWVIAIRDDVPF